MKILVVKEGNANHKQMYEHLEAFGRQNDLELSLLVAADPKEAVKAIITAPIDIIFIGASVANAQSLYALGIIRKHSQHTLIVAISDACELLIDKEYILKSGAEFCIAEPMDMAEFNRQIEHYCFVAAHRKTAPLKALNSIYNCLNTHVHAYKSLFVIENEEHIAEFWEHCSFNIMTDKVIGKTIHALYQIATQALHKGYKPIILMEYTDETIYFTMSAIEHMNEHRLHTLLDQQIAKLPIKIIRDRFTIAVPKQSEQHSLLCCDLYETQPTSELEKPVFSSAIEVINPSFLTKIVPKPPLKEVCVCDYLDYEELADIKEYLVKLKSLLLIVSNGDIEEQEVEEMVRYLGGIGKIASSHNESYSIGMAVSALARTIENNERVFREKSSALGELCIAYGNDLETWIRLVFEEGVHDVYCMDESIIFNSTMLCDAIVASESSSTQNTQELDDIFDF